MQSLFSSPFHINLEAYVGNFEMESLAFNAIPLVKDLLPINFIDGGNYDIDLLSFNINVKLFVDDLEDDEKATLTTRVINDRGLTLDVATITVLKKNDDSYAGQMILPPKYGKSFVIYRLVTSKGKTEIFVTDSDSQTRYLYCIVKNGQGQSEQIFKFVSRKCIQKTGGSHWRITAGTTIYRAIQDLIAGCNGIGPGYTDTLKLLGDELKAALSIMPIHRSDSTIVPLKLTEALNLYYTHRMVERYDVAEEKLKDIIVLLKDVNTYF